VRRCLQLLWCVCLAAADVTQLGHLHERHRTFELRRALEQPGLDATGTLFYRAVAAARFGHEPQAIEDLRTFLAANPDPAIERKAYEELASALVRIGRYGEAASAWAEALRLTPRDEAGRDGNENTHALYESLRDVAPQAIEFGEEVPVEATHNLAGSWNVPVEVNGHLGEWIFDTGANLSTLTESEAMKMGLSTRQTGAYVNGSTGKKNPLRLAVAGDLRFGTAHLRNVVFLVLADEKLYVGPLKYQIRGILGLPVLRALASLRMSANGSLRFGANAPAVPGDPNLFFDELNPIVETRHADRRLQMFLDTGANATCIYPSFRDAMSQGELAKLKRKRETTGGAGGIVKRQTEVVPTLRLEFLSRAVDITNVSLLSSQPLGNARYRDGVIGADALADGFTLDFRTMQLRIE
jgi:predicted aspartyl protease